MLRVRIFGSIDINRIPVCTLSIIEFDVELSSNSYDIVRILSSIESEVEFDVYRSFLLSSNS
jgi:hypothetical protein